MKEKYVDIGFYHFASRTCTSNDDGKAIFSLEALDREIENLKDNKYIGLDKVCPIILKRCKAAQSRPLLLFSRRASLKALFLFIGSKQK